MKIAYLLGSLNRGGTETLLLDIFKNASKTNYDFIGVHRKGGLLQENFYKTGQMIIKLFPQYPFDIIYLYKLRKLLKKERIEIVHAQQPLDGIYAWIACLGTKIKIIQTFHGYDNLNLTKRKKMVSFIAKRTDKNIYVSYSQKNFYQEKYNLEAKKQVVVYNGISFDKIDNVAKVIPLPYKNRLLIGSIGNFVAVRDQMTICRFLNLLNLENIDFDFVFVGARNDVESWRYDDCVQYCRDNNLLNKVHFLGSRDDVPNILKQLDAFIYSTNHDTFGIAVVEAIAAGIPAFVNDWEVMKEITCNGKLAILYKTKNIKDLLAKVKEYLHDPDVYEKRAKEASVEIVRLYSIEKHINELFKVYNLVKNN